MSDEKTLFELYQTLKEWNEGKVDWHDIEYDWIPLLSETILKIIEKGFNLKVVSEEVRAAE